MLLLSTQSRCLAGRQPSRRLHKPSPGQPNGKKKGARTANHNRFCTAMHCCRLYAGGFKLFSSNSVSGKLHGGKGGSSGAVASTAPLPPPPLVQQVAVLPTPSGAPLLPTEMEPISPASPTHEKTKHRLTLPHGIRLPMHHRSSTDGDRQSIDETSDARKDDEQSAAVLKSSEPAVLSEEPVQEEQSDVLPASKGQGERYFAKILRHYSNDTNAVEQRSGPLLAHILETYRAYKEDEINVVEGDTVTVLQRHEGEDTRSEVDAHGIVGRIPNRVLRFLDAPNQEEDEASTSHSKAKLAMYGVQVGGLGSLFGPDGVPQLRRAPPPPARSVGDQYEASVASHPPSLQPTDSRETDETAPQAQQEKAAFCAPPVPRPPPVTKEWVAPSSPVAKAPPVPFPRALSVPVSGQDNIPPYGEEGVSKRKP